MKRLKAYYIFNFKSFVSIALICALCFVVVFAMNIHSVSVINNTVSVLEKTIIIDAGHGGEDGGTQSKNGILEKDINLSISEKVYSYLTSLGINAVMVREGDYLIYDKDSNTIRQKKVSDIHNRLKFTQLYKNCIFVSIHQNYFTESKYYGAQVFYSKNNPDSKLIAENIQSKIRNNLQPENERVIKQSGTEIYLLYHSTVPTVMVECGFLSNSTEAEKLNNEDYQKKMALSIIEGIIDFI